jgi:hypothetical protein
MRQKSGPVKEPETQVLKNIRQQLGKARREVLNRPFRGRIGEKVGLGTSELIEAV